MTRGRLRRGAFSPLDLQATIHRYLAAHNADPKPFVWIMTPQTIMARLKPPNASMDQDFLCSLDCASCPHAATKGFRTTSTRGSVVPSLPSLRRITPAPAAVPRRPNRRPSAG